jgi:hypothetical protein
MSRDTTPSDIDPTPHLHTLPASDRARVTRLYFDVDDTLTWRGELPEEAVRALYRAHRAGLQLVAVTGRSFAWAELLVRFFPLAAAVAETGAVALLKDGARLHVLHHEPDATVRAEHTRRRHEAAARVLHEVPGARLALDNGGRIYDVAFDLVEEGPRVSDDDATRIRALLASEGLTVAQSSVHINAWFGSFDKARMVDRLLRTQDTTLDDVTDTLCYVGDSKNDGAMFARTHVSVGVANVAPHLPALHALGQAPRFVVDGQGGHGFAQIVELLVSAREGRAQ